jgi:hypothetical protein
MYRLAGKTATSSAISPHPAGRRSRGNDQADPAEDFEEAADGHQSRRRRKRRWHDPAVDVGNAEMIRAGDDEERGEEAGVDRRSF